MARQPINTGTTANDGTGDTFRAAMIKSNENFTELYAADGTLQTNIDGKADASHSHAASDVTSGTFPDARISESSVTQHQGALTVTEGQISDLGVYETASGSSTLTNKDIDGDNNTITNLDLGNEVDWASADDVSDAGAFASGDKIAIFEAGVGLRKIDYDDLPGAGGGLSNIVEDTTPQLGGDLDANGHDIDMGSNVITDAAVGQWIAAYGWGDHSSEGYITGYTVTEGDVTAHEAALTITESQISDLGTYLTGITSESVGSLSDVTLTSPSNGQVLKYNGTVWINDTDSGGGGGDAWGDAVDADIVPDANNTRDLGSDSARFAEAHTQALYVAGEQATKIADPAGDAIAFFDDSAGDVAYLTTLTGLTISGTTLTADVQSVAGETGAITAGDLRTALNVADGATANTGDLLAANNLSDLDNAGTARTNLGLGTAATTAATAYATAAQGAVAETEVVQIVIFHADEDVETGNGAGGNFMRIPAKLNGWNLTDAEACVSTAGTTGTTDIQVHNVTDAADMLSTVMTIDSGETDTSTAATARVIDGTADDVATGDQIRIDVDAVSTTAPQGLVVELTFEAP